MSGVTAYVFSTRDAVASWEVFRFIRRFRVQPDGANNSLPLWENNSCFFVCFFLEGGGGGGVTQVLGYNTAN